MTLSMIMTGEQLRFTPYQPAAKAEEFDLQTANDMQQQEEMHPPLTSASGVHVLFVRGSITTQREAAHCYRLLRIGSHFST